ncbi:hypothetical protein WAB17_12020 [Parerythrobacter aurantius]|uniref:hypothetical protein n=1 Tax=Parerythrobacter aurantius TaxID=3127706 RepID=UPI00324A813C
MIALKLAANLCGALALVIGLLVKLSPTPSDQLGGNIIICVAVVGLVVVNMTSGWIATIAQWDLCIPVIVAVGYFIVRKFV